MKRSFLFGAATSAHQVEGSNVHSDWWEWEKKTPGIERSGQAVDHYHRFREDFALARALGHTAHRLSIEWSRIEPAPGMFNRNEIQHYREVLQELRRQHLVSFVTLWHFTSPQWFMKRGGWLAGDAPELFGRYVNVIAEELGDLIDFWVTVNEPMVYATMSYWRKRWPPQHRSIRGLTKTVAQLARAHGVAYRKIHRLYPAAQVGMAKHLIAYVPDQEQQLDDRLFAGLENWWFNRRWFALTGNTHDFIGVNYYFTRKLRVHVFPPSMREVDWPGPKSDIGWAIRPEGLTHVLLEMKRYNKPIYITENGLADADDSKRSDFIRAHLRAVEKAQAQGADVRGYLHWSLLDNFEWDLGFKPRFGLVEVDYETLTRKPRPSAYVYKAIIEQAQKM